MLTRTCAFAVFTTDLNITEDLFVRESTCVEVGILFLLATSVDKYYHQIFLNVQLHFVRSAFLVVLPSSCPQARIVHVHRDTRFDPQGWHQESYEDESKKMSTSGWEHFHRRYRFLSTNKRVDTTKF